MDMIDDRPPDVTGAEDICSARPAGSIEFGDPRGVGKPENAVQINLLETADASTFFHELGLQRGVKQRWK